MEHEKQTRSGPSDLVTPELIESSELSPDRQRKQVETAVGNALTDTFERNAEFVTQDARGRDTLKLRVPYRDKEAPVTVSREINDEGIRTTYLTFGAGWENNWQYIDGPDQEGRLIPCTRDPETGEFTPMPAAAPGNYDPTSDEEVAFWGKPWIDNLRDGTPEIPKGPSRLRTFGRSILRRLKN